MSLSARPHFLIGHDLSPSADRALQRAVVLARRHQAQLTLAHILPPGQDAATARNHLEYSRQQLADTSVGIHLRQGPVVHELQTLTQGLDADLVLFGLHQDGNGVPTFGGTTLERFLLATPVPVLMVVRRPQADYQRLLALLDFSPCASRALQQALGLLGETGQRCALNVFEMAELHSLDAEERALQEELLDGLLAEQGPAWDPQLAERQLLAGERSHCIHDWVQRWQPDLISLGLHARGEMSAALVGSLVRELLTAPPCDLLLGP